MTTTDTTTTKRADYIAGLRQLADALDADPDLPLPWDGTAVSRLSVFTATRAECAAWARVLGHAEKEISDDYYGFKLTGQVSGVQVLVYAPRAEVCTRRVVGTREVTKEIPDPDALAAVPTVTVTETVEDIAWDCHPLLSDVTS